MQGTGMVETSNRYWVVVRRDWHLATPDAFQ